MNNRMQLILSYIYGHTKKGQTLYINLDKEGMWIKMAGKVTWRAEGVKDENE